MNFLYIIALIGLNMTHNNKVMLKKLECRILIARAADRYFGPLGRAARNPLGYVNLVMEKPKKSIIVILMFLSPGLPQKN